MTILPTCRWPPWRHSLNMSRRCFNSSHRANIRIISKSKLLNNKVPRWFGQAKNNNNNNLQRKKSHNRKFNGHPKNKNSLKNGRKHLKRGIAESTGWVKRMLSQKKRAGIVNRTQFSGHLKKHLLLFSGLLKKLRRRNLNLQQSKKTTNKYNIKNLWEVVCQSIYRRVTTTIMKSKRKHHKRKWFYPIDRCNRGPQLDQTTMKLIIWWMRMLSNWSRKTNSHSLVKG